jgi:hypothetical protein
LISVFFQKADVKKPVLIAKEDLLPPIPSLDDMMRQAGNNDASDARHDRFSSFLPMILGSLVAEFCLKVIMTSHGMSDSQKNRKNSDNGLSVTEFNLSPNSKQSFFPDICL